VALVLGKFQMIHYIMNQYDLIEECRNHMSENGLACTNQIITDGKIHRYSIDAQKNKRDEWYIAYEGTFGQNRPYLTVTYGSWSTGLRYVFKSGYQADISDQERHDLQSQFERRKMEAEQQIKDVQNNAAKVAEKIWKEALNEPPSQDYLAYSKSKGIEAIGAKFLDFNKSDPSNKSPRIVIPLKNIKGEIRSLQSICVNEYGKTVKRFLPDGEKKGNFYNLGELVDGNPIYITEGWATGVSVYATKIGTVVIAYDANNLLSVIENLKQAFTKSAIIIAGDNDEVGIQKANAAAGAFQCRIIFPEFPEDKKIDSHGKPYTDFNDLHQICGLEEVKKQLDQVHTIVSAPEALKNIAEESLKIDEPCATFSPNLLPPILCDYINSICATTRAHPIMVTSAVLGMISAFIGRRVFISEDKYFQVLYPNIWMINITYSGQFKSTALNKGAKLALERSREVSELTKSLRKELQLESDAKKIKDIKERIVEISLRDVVLPTKVTTEALLEHLGQGHSGVILPSEFGGWLLNLEKSYNGDLKALLTELYDAPRSYRYKTITRGDFILNEPYISICGVSTLAWLKAHIRPEDFASGFFARFLIFVPPHEYEIPPALPTRQNTSDLKSEQALRDVLQNMDSFYSYSLSNNAERAFECLHKDIYKITHSYSDKCREILEPHLKRWSPCLLKLAMIMQLFTDPKSKEIGVEALNSAYAILLPAIKSTALLIEGELGESAHQRKCRKVYEWICKTVKSTGLPIRRQCLFSSRQLDGGGKEYDYVLTTLIEQGKILCEETIKKNDWLYKPIQQLIEKIGDNQTPFST
jgi:putative DNA primase/helicase